MESVRFSIVTPVYNGETFIARTIRSVLDQMMPPYEYNIVDGGSTDRTVEICDSYREQFAEKGIRYQVVSEKDQGIYDGMNKGIRRSSGDFIGIINADDWYEKTALETMQRLYEKTHFDMAYADIRMHNGESTFIKRASNPKFVSSRTWNHPTQFTSREIYQKKLYRNQSVFDDLDVLLWIHRHGYHIEVVNEVLANFTMGGASNNEKKWPEVRKRIRLKAEIYRANGYSWRCGSRGDREDGAGQGRVESIEGKRSDTNQNMCVTEVGGGSGSLILLYATFPAPHRLSKVKSRVPDAELMRRPEDI